MGDIDKLFAGAAAVGMVIALLWGAFVITVIVLVLQHFGVV